MAGKVLVENRRLLNHDVQQLIDNVNHAAPALFARRVRWLNRSDGCINALYQP
jgi:5-methylthioadenosine/S-adenosylhomocysteine deaminase